MVASRLRSLTKAITYRISGSIITCAIAYVATDEIAVALSVGIFDILIKIMFYYLHERFWDGIQWGREK